MDEADYIKLLDHALSQLPTDVMKHDKFILPDMANQIFIEGSKTLIKNFKALAEKAGRDPKHFMKFIVSEVGSAGTYDEQLGRAILSGVSKKLILDTIDKYVRDFVVCKTCGRPDTVLDKEGRQAVLRCKVCGSSRAIPKL